MTAANPYRFWINDDNDRSKVYRALLAQILEAHRYDQAVVDKFILAMKYNSSGQLIASGNELRELFLLCLQSVGDYYLVLDGIDERVYEDDLFEDDLREAAKCPGLRILIFSRPAGASVQMDAGSRSRCVRG